MNVNVVTFDLDGTLVNTLPAIAKAFNEILKKYSYKTFEEEKYMDFIGKGFGVVFDKIKIIRNIKEEKEQFLSEVRSYYNENYYKGIYLYEGIPELLDYLQKKGKILAIITNKDQIATLKHVKTILSKWKFKYIYGNPEDKSYPAKPNPYAINEILKEGYKKDEIVHIGDMKVDYDMAKNAGIKQIHCKYGYEKKASIYENSVACAKEIMELIK